MKSKTYRKIFLTFLTVIIAYTIFIMVIVINNEVNQRKTEQTTQSIMTLENSAFRIDQQLRFALNSMKSLATKESIILFSQSTESDYALFSAMYDEIRENYLLMNQFEYSIGILNPENHIIVSSDGYFVYNDFFSFLNIETKAGLLSEMLADASFSSSIFETLDQRLIMLHKEQVENQTLYFFAYWKKNELLSPMNQEIQVIDHQYPSSETNSPILTDFTQNTIQQEAKSDTIVFTKNSEVLPFANYQLTTAIQSSFPLSTISSFLLPLMVLIVLGALIVVFLSKRMYKPYLEILDEIKKSNVDILTVDDINLALHQIIESSSSINQLQSPVSEEVKELFLKNLLYGKYTYNMSKSLLPTFHLEGIEKGGSFAFLTFSGAMAEEATFNETEIIHVRKQLIKKNLHIERYDIISFSEKHLVILFYDQEYSQIMKEIDQLKLTIEDSLNLRMTYLLSKPFHSLEHFIEVFHETCQWSDECNGNNQFHQIPVPTSNAFHKINYTVDEEQLLIQYFKVGDFVHARELLQQIVEINISSNRSLGFLQEFSTALTLTIKRIAVIKEISYPEFYEQNKKQFLYLKKGFSDPDVKKTIFFLFDTLITQIETTENNNGSKTDEIIQFINSNYCSDLSLTDIAQQFHLSEAYLSRLIKERLSMSFKPYVNQLRVEKAKRLMSEQESSINEIASKVGFKNTNSFIRVFKQFEGTTPGTYRTNKIH